MNPPFRSKPELVCSQCGRPGAFAFDEPLCADCYHARGSCGAVREVEQPESAEKVKMPQSELDGI
jgi:hypothetical protein